ncbi:hypothetical protein GCM10011413_08120 [Pedobacter psychrotolerans]|nr:hypothetical protein GCM10011413_08120 [Pedobacter psychrotolerans]
MLAGKQEMIKASTLLPPIISNQKGYKIYFLTGQNYLYQTLFCAFSLKKVSKIPFQFILIDDGSFDQKLINQANEQMPDVKIITKQEVEANLESKLPIKDFPYLHYKRKVYPHIKKLTDIHTIGDETYKLVLDSDMLFWNEPLEMINWLKDPEGCLYMLDTVESYGYDKKLMHDLCGFEIPKLLNVGVFGSNSKNINWSNLENWSQELEYKQGGSYFLEQALSAMLIANEQKTILNKKQYIVNPEDSKSDDEIAKLKHYVDLSKKYYFEKAWKNI